MNESSINITKFGDLTPKERFFTLLEGKEADRAAVINPTSVATVESSGKLGINFSEVHLDSEKMMALAAYSYENLGFDSVMPYFSVVQEAAAFGCGIDWGTGDAMPNQKSAVFTDPEQFKMDGKGQALDNIRTDRFFRSLKYDDIYINEYTTPREMIAGVNNYMLDYNAVRPHASLGGLTPNTFYQRQTTNQAA